MQLSVPGLDTPSAIVLVEMAGKSGKQQVPRSCLEVGILRVLVSPDNLETEDLLHPGINAT